MEGRYCSVESRRSRNLLGNLASPYYDFLFFFPGLYFIRAFICKADIIIEICLDELESFPLALKRRLLNSATAVLLQSILNISNIVIGTTSIIKGVNYQYIVRRVTIKAGGLFSIRSIFCAVFFPKDIPAYFEFAQIPKCYV